jgi:RimJ/RimL family protein N-acetyltransferase
MPLLIRSERLEISTISEQDLEEVRILHNDPETLRWLSDTRKVSVQNQKIWFEAIKDSKTSQRYVVRSISDKKLVGVFRFDNFDATNRSVNIGLDIDTKSRRLGYARETYETLIPYFFTVLQINRLALITLSTNLAAINLYEQLGFKREGILREAFYRKSIYLDAYQYSLLSSEIRV